MAAFGEVTTVDSTDPGASTPQSTQNIPDIDPNDPRLVSESLETNEQGDAYATLPPIPDGKWRAKLSVVDIKDPKTGQPSPTRTILTMATWKNPPAPFFAINLQSTVLDATGKHDGVTLTEYWVKTLVDERRGVSALSTIARKAGANIPVGATQKAVLDAALARFAAEPEVVIETQWEARCQSCEETATKKGEKKPKPFLYGMDRFPLNPDRTHSPEVQCPVCKGMCRGQARIVGYFPVTTPHN